MDTKEYLHREDLKLSYVENKTPEIKVVITNTIVKKLKVNGRICESDNIEELIQHLCI
jgi:hypothetical protein